MLDTSNSSEDQKEPVQKEIAKNNSKGWPKGYSNMMLTKMVMGSVRNGGNLAKPESSLIPETYPPCTLTAKFLPGSLLRGNIAFTVFVRGCLMTLLVPVDIEASGLDSFHFIFAESWETHDHMVCQLKAAPVRPGFCPPPV